MMKRKTFKRYVAERKKRDKAFAEGYEEGYEQFKIGVVLKQAREKAGLTQEELAQRLIAFPVPLLFSKGAMFLRIWFFWDQWPQYQWSSCQKALNKLL